MNSQVGGDIKTERTETVAMLADFWSFKKTSTTMDVASKRRK
jgi:hypothetical protein